jgi:hypothetical protein
LSSGVAKGEMMYPGWPNEAEAVGRERGARVAKRAHAQPVFLVELIERADRDAAGVEASGECLVEGLVDIAMLENRVSDVGKNRELGRQGRAALREPGVDHHLTLELPEHAPIALALELLDLDTTDRGGWLRR